MGVIRDRWRTYENDQLLARAAALGLGGGISSESDPIATAALASKQDASTAATDAELAAGLSTKQDAATAATDAELAAAVAGASGGLLAVFTATDPLTVASGTRRVYNDTGKTLTIAKVRASLGTAGTTATTVDVNKGGTTIFTTQGNRPSLGNGVATTTAVPAVTSWEDGSYLTVDVDVVGTSAAGLVVQVHAA